MDRQFYRFVLILLWVCFINAAWAGWPGEARITQFARDVQAIDANGKARRASFHATIAPGSTIRTGNDSRAEVTIGDEIAIRLAANSELTLGVTPGNIDLKKG